MVISPTTKSVVGSDVVNVSVSVWPDLSAPAPERVIVTVGASVSVAIERIELHDEFEFPAASSTASGPIHNDAVELATLVLGVNVAV